MLKKNIIPNTSYDYIIAGAGCAGLSLLLRIMQEPFFREKKILLIDSDDKKKNDRTWCFWEAKPGLFQDIVYKEWNTIDFYGEAFSGRWDIAPYLYKMIRGKDLYRYVFQQVSLHSNIVFLQGKIKRIYSENNTTYVQTDDQLFTAQYVFNSILFNPEKLKTGISLLQHFKGWMIVTEEDTFNSSVATFMDFRIATKEGNTFVYVLPVTKRKALIEYTVFSSALLQEDEYNQGLRKYISQFLNLSNFIIEEEEFGVIPMSNFTFAKPSAGIVNIGTAGGQTKGSSGYTFQFIQKHSATLVGALIKGETPGENGSLLSKRFKIYDDTLLQVLYSKRLTAAQVFSDLFKHNKPQQVFKFLDNETNLKEELKIMSSVPSRIFLPAAGRQILGF